MMILSFLLDSSRNEVKRWEWGGYEVYDGTTQLYKEIGVRVRVNLRL